MKRVPGACSALLLLLTIIPGAEAGAQSVAPASGTIVPMAEHQQRLQQLRTILLACEAKPSDCDANRVGPDERVLAAPGLTTRIRYEWLREGIRQLGVLKDADRDQLAAELGNRLDEEAGAQPAAVSADAVKTARAQIARVLALPEFAPPPPPNWLQRKWTQFWEWVRRQLERTFMATAGSPPWLRILFEGLLLVVPVILLAIWLIRLVREDRRLPRGPLDSSGPREIETEEDWVSRAEQHARVGEWRDAIHALYWATIAQFEKRKVWTASRTRTPREYLRMLKPESSATAPLREQTRLLETTWYGYRAATANDYDRAQHLHKELTAP